MDGTIWRGYLPISLFPGYKTEGASVPWPFSYLVPKWRRGDDEYNAAPTAHGWVKVPRGFETAFDLCFWGKSEASITHVSIAVGPRQHLEAGGGGSGSKSAGTSTGMVRVRPLSSRGDLLAALRMP